MMRYEVWIGSYFWSEHTTLPAAIHAVEQRIRNKPDETTSGHIRDLTLNAVVLQFSTIIPLLKL